jgi:hypothetical protein
MCKPLFAPAGRLQGGSAAGLSSGDGCCVRGAPAHLEGVPQHALPLLAGAQHSKGVHLGALLVLEVDLVPVQRLPSDGGQVLSQSTMNVTSGCPFMWNFCCGHGTLSASQADHLVDVALDGANGVGALFEDVVREVRRQPDLVRVLHVHALVQHIPHLLQRHNRQPVSPLAHSIPTVWHSASLSHDVKHDLP